MAFLILSGQHFVKQENGQKIQKHFLFSVNGSYKVLCCLHNLPPSPIQTHLHKHFVPCALSAFYPTVTHIRATWRQYVAQG